MKLARTKEWRESHGLTQRELAAQAGVGEVTVARIETGASVTPPTARKIAGALGVAVADLLERPPVHYLRTVHDSTEVSDDVKTRLKEQFDALIHDLEMIRRSKEAAELVRVRDELLAAV